MNILCSSILDEYPTTTTATISEYMYGRYLVANYTLVENHMLAMLKPVA